MGTQIDFLTGASAFPTIYIASGIWQDAGWGCIIYLVIRDTGLIGNMWSLFLPDGVAVDNMIIVRNYFKEVIFACFCYWERAASRDGLCAL